MDGATATQLGSGEAVVMFDEADTVQATQQGARGATQQGARGRRRRGSAPASCTWAASIAVT